MTFTDQDFFNACNQLVWLRKDRDSYRMDRHRPAPNDDDAPKVPGFTYLGCGRDREVWGFGGFAFKLQHPMRQTTDANESEYQNYVKITSSGSLPANWCIPETFLVHVEQEPVIVMQEAPGTVLSSLGYEEADSITGSSSFFEAMQQIGITDMANCNFSYHEGIIYALDLTT